MLKLHYLEDNKSNRGLDTEDFRPKQHQENYSGLKSLEINTVGNKHLVNSEKWYFIHSY